MAMKRIFYSIAKFLVVSFSRLPMAVLYGFSSFLYFLAYYVVRYRVKVVKSNLKIVFPQKSDKELKDVERKFYRHLCDYFVETLKALTISHEELQSRMRLRNPEMVNDLTAEGRMVFIYAPHFGNWEWYIAFAKLFGEVGLNAFYKRQHGLIEELTDISRSRNNITIVPSHKGYRHMVSCARDGKPAVTLIIADQSPSRGAQKCWTTFFGQDTAFLMGPVTMAKKLNIAMVYPSYASYRRGYYEVEMKMIEESPLQSEMLDMVAKFAEMIEADVNKYPELWLWSHRRWKLRHEDFPDE